MRKLLGIFALLIFFFSILFSSGCATTSKSQPKCTPGQIVLLDNPGWIKLDANCEGTPNVEVHHIDIYTCGEDGSLKSLNLMSVYDGCKYILVGKHYKLLGEFKNEEAMKEHILKEFEKAEKQRQ